MRLLYTADCGALATNHTTDQATWRAAAQMQAMEVFDAPAMDHAKEQTTWRGTTERGVSQMMHRSRHTAGQPMPYCRGCV